MPVAMRCCATFLACCSALGGVPAAAQDRDAGEWMVVQDIAAPSAAAGLARAEEQALAAYGPFVVLDRQTAALTGVTDSASPADFAQMLHAFPQIATLRFHDCPGTEDDVANLRLGRMIRAGGIAVEVPDGGSVRSGAVELVLAGARIAIADGAEFAVHGWIDDQGRGAADYAPGAPEHGKYLAYYRDMGMAEGQAQAFYAMTNSVPFESALWLGAADMGQWVPLD